MIVLKDKRKCITGYAIAIMLPWVWILVLWCTKDLEPWDPRYGFDNIDGAACYLMYIICLLVFGAGSYVLLKWICEVSWISLAIGGVESIFLCVPGVWKSTLYGVYALIAEGFPLTIFVSALLFTMYIILAIVKIRKPTE